MNGRIMRLTLRIFQFYDKFVCALHGHLPNQRLRRTFSLWDRTLNSGLSGVNSLEYQMGP